MNPQRAAARREHQLDHFVHNLRRDVRKLVRVDVETAVAVAEQLARVVQQLLDVADKKANADVEKAAEEEDGPP